MSKKDTVKNIPPTPDNEIMRYIDIIQEENRGYFKMIFERFTIVDNKLIQHDHLFETHSEMIGKLMIDMTEVKTDVAELKTDVAVLKTDVAVLKTDVAVLKTDVAVLKTDMIEVKSDIKVLKNDVGVLKSDMVEVKTDIKVLKTDVKEIKNDLKNKADVKDVNLINFKIKSLENNL